MSDLALVVAAAGAWTFAIMIGIFAENAYAAPKIEAPERVAKKGEPVFRVKRALNDWSRSRCLRLGACRSIIWARNILALI